MKHHKKLETEIAQKENRDMIDITIDTQWMEKRCVTTSKAKYRIFNYTSRAANTRIFFSPNKKDETPNEILYSFHVMKKQQEQRTSSGSEILQSCSKEMLLLMTIELTLKIETTCTKS